MPNTVLSDITNTNKYMLKYSFKEIIENKGGAVEEELTWHTWKVNTAMLQKQFMI